MFFKRNNPEGQTNPQNEPSKEAIKSPEFEVTLSSAISGKKKYVGDKLVEAPYELEDGVFKSGHSRAVANPEQGNYFGVTATRINHSHQDFLDKITEDIRGYLDDPDNRSQIGKDREDSKLANLTRGRAKELVHQEMWVGIAGVQLQDSKDGQMLSWFSADTTRSTLTIANSEGIHKLIRSEGKPSGGIAIDPSRNVMSVGFECGRIRLTEGRYRVVIDPGIGFYKGIGGLGWVDMEEEAQIYGHPGFEEIITDLDLSTEEAAKKFSELHSFASSRAIQVVDVEFTRSSPEQSSDASDSPESQKSTRNLLGALAATASKVKSALSRSKPELESNESPKNSTNKDDESQPSVEEEPEVVEAEILPSNQLEDPKNSEEIPEIEIVDDEDDDSKSSNPDKPSTSPLIYPFPIGPMPQPIPRDRNNIPLDPDNTNNPDNDNNKNPDDTDPNNDPNSQHLVPRSPEITKRERIAKRAKKLGNKALHPILFIPRKLAQAQSSPEKFANKFKSEKAKNAAYLGAGVVTMVGIGIAAKFMFFDGGEDTSEAVPGPAESSPTSEATETTQAPNPEPTSSGAPSPETQDPTTPTTSPSGETSESTEPSSSPSPSKSPEADNGTGVGNEDIRDKPGSEENGSNDGSGNNNQNGNENRDGSSNQNQQPTAPTVEASSVDQRSWSTNPSSEANNSDSSSNPNINQETAFSDSKKLFVNTNGNDVVISANQMSNTPNQAILTVDGEAYQIPLENGRVVVDKDTPIGNILANDTYDSLEVANVSNNTTTILATDLGNGEAKAPEDLSIDQTPEENTETFLNDSLDQAGLGDNYHAEVTNDGNGTYNIQILDQNNNLVSGNIADPHSTGNDDYSINIKDNAEGKSQVQDWFRRAMEGLKR